MSFIRILLILLILFCHRKKLPDNLEIITTRHGEFLLYEADERKRIFFKDIEVFSTDLFNQISLVEIINLNHKDIILLTVETPECPIKILTISIDSNQKYNAFPLIGTCNNLPEIIKKEETVFIQFQKNPKNTLIYKLERENLDLIESSKQTAIDR